MQNKSGQRNGRRLVFIRNLWRFLPFLLCVPPATLNAQHTWTESSFNDFRDGAFLDGGSNLYVSAAGRIQMINRWDFNNDGYLDILLCSGHGHTEKENTYIYLNTDGNVDGRQRIELAGGGSQDGLVADFNQDGYNDLAVANSADSHFSRVNAWIWFGSADGFSPEKRIELPAYHGKSMAAGDFNNDGWLDLAIACQWQAGSSTNPQGPVMSFIYWNSEDGFHAENRLPLEFDGKAATDFAASDLDKDLITDLIALAGNKIYLLLSGHNALADTTAWQSQPLPGKAMALGEINDDGQPDLVVCGNKTVSIYKGKAGSFDFDTPVILPVEQPADVAVGDLNKDGFDDIAVANTATAGGATWTNSYVFFSENGNISEKNKLALPTFAASGISICDLNKDGFAEIIIGNQRITNQLNLCSYIYWNDNGNFFFGNHTQLPTMGTVGTTTGDVNNDGFDDVIFFNEEGYFRDGPTLSHIYWGNGTRGFSAGRSLTFHTHHIFGQAQADLDDDGHVDLILSQERFMYRVPHEQNGLIIYWGEGETFSQSTRLTMVTAYGGSRIADINRDGYLDILVGGAALDLKNPALHGIPIFWGSERGYDLNNRQILHHDIEKMRSPLLMDLNRDGWLDIAGQVRDGEIKIWWGGEHGFTDENYSKYDLGRPDHLMYIKGADLNKDGWLDLLLPKRRPHENFNTSFIYYGSASGFSSENRTEIEANIPYENSIADFDKDGWLDIFMASYGTDLKGNRPSLLHWGSAQGFDQRPPAALYTYGAAASEALDYDGDGWLDILVANHRRAGSLDLPIPHQHTTPSMLYWGGKDGYSDKQRWEIEAAGPSGLNVRDPGNSYDRGFYEDYISSAHTEMTVLTPASISWQADTPFNSAVKFQIRMADTEDGLISASWQGPEGGGSWYEKSGQAVTGKTGRWIQYRARLLTVDGGATPYLSKVSILFE